MAYKYYRNYRRRVFSSKNPMYTRGVNYSRKYNRYIAKPALKAAVPLLKSYLGLNTERKHYTVQYAAGVSSSGPANLNLTNMAQGVGASQRVGDSIRITGSYHTIQVTADAATTVESQKVRVTLVQCKSPFTNGQSPAILQGEVFDSSYPPISTLRNLDRIKEYKVLFDRVITLSKGESENVLIRHYMKHNDKVRFTRGVLDTEFNGLVWILNSDQISNYPGVNLISRLTYVDN